MLHHISVSANNPLHVSEVLAELCHGRAFPFPPCPDAYIVLAGDEFGTAIEVLPSGTEMLPGVDEAEFSRNDFTPQFTPTHIALSVPVDQETIEAIAHREGWLAMPCDRGPFKLIELWVENRFLVELLPPALAADYTRFMTIENIEAFIQQAELVPAMA